jgi:hypothetical protein
MFNSSVPVSSLEVFVPYTPCPERFRRIAEDFAPQLRDIFGASTPECRADFVRCLEDHLVSPKGRGNSA